MKNYAILLVLCVFCSFFSCGGRNEKEASIVMDTLPKAVFNIQPEYFFSGTFFCEKDSAFLKETVTGNCLKIEKNRIYEKLVGKYDSISEKGLLMNVDLRGYLKNNDTISLLYITYIENFVGTDTIEKNLLIGSYTGNGIKLDIYDNHICMISDTTKCDKGEWFMSNDTLLFVKIGNSSCIYDVDWEKHSLYSHKGRNDILNKM